MKAARLAPLIALAAVAGCSRPAPVSARHHHRPPHAGTAVALGDEAYHLEFVVDPARGTLDAYILDGEMENFVRSADRSFAMSLRLAGRSHDLELGALPNPETGETVGDTAQFEGSADWLRGASSFKATIRSVTIRGTTFSGVAFNFPEGNDADERPSL